MTFRRAIAGWAWGDELMAVFDDGRRVIVKNQDGNVMLDCSRFVFDECWKRGWFTD